MVAVIIDEACQATEAECRIPFKYNPTTVTLVGDPQQLPVLSFTSSKIVERSLFERLSKDLHFPTMLLREVSAKDGAIMYSSDLPC